MKKILIGTIVLMIVLGALFILSGIYADRIIDPFVRTLLNENKPLNHKIDYRKIKVNLFKRYIKVKDVNMIPVPGLNKDENLWMEISVSTIRLNDFDIKAMLFDKALNIKDINILQPDVKIHLPLNPPKEILDSIQGDTIQHVKKQLLKSISLERILISEGSFKLLRDSIVLANSTSINFVAEQINLVKNSLEEPIGYTYGNIKISLSDIALHSESGLYDMKMDHFSASKNDSTIILKGFRMTPKYSKKEFSDQLRFQDDRFDVVIGEVAIERISFENLFKNDILKVSAITIDSLQADIYRDKNVAFNVNKFPLFHNEMFLKIGIPFYLDTLQILNSVIQYGELTEGRSQEGFIRLDDFHLYSYNLTNDVVTDTTSNVMHLTVNAKVMGEGPLNAELTLPLENDTRAIECKGSIGAMNLAPLNAMLEPSLNLKFNTGRLDRMTFAFTGNDTRSSGWMEFLYHDLNVELLKKEAEKQWGFISFMANTMTLSNNPAPGKELKIVSIGYDRDKNKGMINYIWKTIQSGMIHTILPVKKYQINRKSDVAKTADTNKSKKKK